MLELINFSCRVNIVGIMKSNRVGWTGEVAQVSEIVTRTKYIRDNMIWRYVSEEIICHLF